MIRDEYSKEINELASKLHKVVCVCDTYDCKHSYTENHIFKIAEFIINNKDDKYWRELGDG